MVIIIREILTQSFSVSYNSNNPVSHKKPQGDLLPTDSMHYPNSFFTNLKEKELPNRSKDNAVGDKQFQSYNFLRAHKDVADRKLLGIL